MLYARLSEEYLRSLYRQGRIVGGVYLVWAKRRSLLPVDVLASGRCFCPADVAGRLAFGEDLAEVFRSYMGKRSGKMRGRDGNVHRGDVDTGMLPMISHLGVMIAPVAGMLLRGSCAGKAAALACCLLVTAA